VLTRPRVERQPALRRTRVAGRCRKPGNGGTDEVSALQMRLASSLRLGGGVRPSLSRSGCRPFPSYSTLASSRPSLSSPPRLPLHPSFFLLHLEGITATSCLIPAIDARETSLTAGEDGFEEGAETVESVASAAPIQQPLPFKYQRVALAAHPRRHLTASPASILRQLYLVNQSLSLLVLHILSSVVRRRGY
jgi:hypothetical protein